MGVCGRDFVSACTCSDPTTLAVLWYRLSKLWLTSTYVGSHYVEEFYFCSKTIHSGILTTEEQLFFVVGWILNNIFSQMNVERLLSS